MCENEKPEKGKPRLIITINYNRIIIMFSIAAKALFIWRKIVPGKRVPLPANYINYNRIIIMFSIAAKALFIWRKTVPGKRVPLPAKSTLASVYMRKELTLLPPVPVSIIRRLGGQR